MSDDPSNWSPFVRSYLPALLAQAAHMIQGEFHEVVVSRGVTVSEWRLLGTLSDGTPRSTGDIARTALIKLSSATRVVDRLEARRQVKRVRHPTDRRVVLISITREGLTLFKELKTLALEHERRVLEPFGLDRSAELKDILWRMIQEHKAAASSSDHSLDE